MSTYEEMVEHIVRRVLREELRPLLEAKPTTPAEMLKPKQAAAIVSVAVSTLRAWVKRGLLKAHGSGRGLRYERAAVLAALDAASAPAPTLDADAWATARLRRRAN